MQVGEILRSHYRIIKRLGNGAFGETYLAEDLDIPSNPKPKCVVKHLRPQTNDPSVIQIAMRLFNQEALTLESLGKLHSQIPKLFAYFQENEEFYLVQEFIDGEDLTHEIFPGQRWEESQVKQLLEEVLEVLVVVHQRHIIHRDIKPANLMRRRDGKIILIDFGAVKETMAVTLNPQGQPNPTVTIGTKGYMPNEQAVGEPRLCSDVYAVGMLGIYALTGIQPRELPKDPTTGNVIWRNWASVSEGFAGVLDRMVLYHFSQRYQDAAAALQALVELKPKPRGKPQPPLQPQSQSQSQSQSQPKPRREIIKILGGLFTGVGLTAVGGKFLQGNSGTDIYTPTNTLEPPPSFSPTATPTTTSVELQTFPFETVTVNAKGEITNRRQLSAKSLVEDLGNGVTLEMVQIPGGTFTMGSPPGEARRIDDEGPQRQVTVPGFFMGRYTVNQAQYQAIMGNNPAYSKGEERPVERVSWNDAVEFCKKLSQKTGRNYRLPSESEWEYACRAGKTTPFHFGETITTELVNYNGNQAYASAPKGKYREQTTEVGQFPPNTFGLYDMHGNVWEWCQDTWHENYSGAPNNGSPWVDNNNQYRLLRGGSWDYNPENCRSAYRGRDTPTHRDNNGGFRVVILVA